MHKRYALLFFVTSLAASDPTPQTLYKDAESIATTLSEIIEKQSRNEDPEYAVKMQLLCNSSLIGPLKKVDSSCKEAVMRLILSYEPMLDILLAFFKKNCTERRKLLEAREKLLAVKEILAQQRPQAIRNPYGMYPPGIYMPPQPAPHSAWSELASRAHYFVFGGIVLYLLKSRNVQRMIGEDNEIFEELRTLKEKYDNKLAELKETIEELEQNREENEEEIERLNTEYRTLEQLVRTETQQQKELHDVTKDLSKKVKKKK